MLLQKFISALLPSFEKDRLISDIRITQGEISELQVAYDEAAKLLKSWTFKSTQVKDKFATFKRIVGVSENPIVYLDKNFATILKNLQLAEEQASANLSNTVAGRGITYKQATIIQYCDSFFLISKYARKFLNYVYVFESMEFREGLDLTDEITKAELKWIDESLLDFCNAVKSATDEPKKVLESIQDIPEIEVTNSNASTLKSTLGEHKIDPLRMGFIASRYNPIYFVRMISAEWQVKRYKEMKEELALLQLRRMNLEKLKSGKEDAKLDSQISYVVSRSQELAYEIAQMEGTK